MKNLLGNLFGIIKRKPESKNITQATDSDWNDFWYNEDGDLF